MEDRSWGGVDACRRSELGSELVPALHIVGCPKREEREGGEGRWGLHDGGFGLLLLVAGVAGDRNDVVEDGRERGLGAGCRGFKEKTGGVLFFVLFFKIFNIKVGPY